MVLSDAFDAVAGDIDDLRWSQLRDEDVWMNRCWWLVLEEFFLGIIYGLPFELTGMNGGIDILELLGEISCVKSGSWSGLLSLSSKGWRFAALNLKVEGYRIFGSKWIISCRRNVR